MQEGSRNVLERLCSTTTTGLASKKEDDDDGNDTHYCSDSLDVSVGVKR